MRFGHAAAPMRLFDDDRLRFRREADERRPREVRRAAELDEVRALVEIRADGRPQLLRAQVDEIFADALRDLVVHLLLKERQPLFANQAEAHRVGSAPADDVPGREDARPDRATSGDPIAHGGERHEQAVTVAHRRHTVFELELGRFEDDVLLA